MVRLLLCTVLVYYIWTTTAGTGTFDLTRKDYGAYVSYNHLTDALLSGKINLLVEPQQELLKLSDPYDPVLNAPYRFHDASLYKSKYYFYWGFVPAIFLYIPYHLITGYYLPDNIAVLVFVFGGLIWASLLIFHLKKVYFQRISEWILAITIGTIGFADLGGFFLRESGVYQVAISSAFFFLIGAIYWFCLAFSNIHLQSSAKKLLIGSLFLGLSCGCRAHFVLATTIAIFISILNLKVTTNQSIKEIIKEPRLYFLIVPFLFCLSVLGIYNYLRFDSPFEFGFRYQTGLYNYNKTNYFNPAYLSTNIYYFIFQPPVINSIFPYIHMAPSAPSFLKPLQLQYMLEPIIGIIPATPFVLLILLAPLIYFLEILKKTLALQLPKFPTFEFSIVFFTACINILILISGGAATLRYIADFIALLIISSSIVWFYLDNSLANKSKNKLILRVIAVILAIYSICVGIVISFTGAGERFVYENPETYYKVKKFFEPMSEALLKIIPSDEGNWGKINNELKQFSLPVNIIASSTHSDAYNINNAIDSNLNTDWVAKNSSATTLVITTDQPGIIKSIWLLARKHRLLECWKKVEAKLYLKDKPISSQTFILPDAHKKRLQHIEFHPTEVNKIELVFSDPVTINLSGKNEDPGGLCPGYTEILFEWLE